MTKDLSNVPTDWLEAFVELISEDDRGSLATDIEAIYRMRDIERREGRNITASPDAARAELANRKDPDGSQRRAAEFYRVFIETMALQGERAELEVELGNYRRGPLLPLLNRLDKIDARLAKLRA